VTSGPGLLPDSLITLTLDPSSVTAGTHTIKVWIMDVNKITDVNATNDAQSLQFTLAGKGYGALNYSENFENVTPGQIPAEWSAYDPDANGNWFVYATGTNKAAAFNNFAYTGAKNKKDELVMPVIDLTGNSSIWFSFDLCHASRPAPTAYDSLEVLISTDCGVTFTSVWGKGGAALNTVADNASLFIPAGPQDYKNVQVDLSAYTTSGNAIIKFVNWSNNGNSTLVDNLHFILNTTTGVWDNSVNGSLNVFPSPAKDMITINGQFSTGADMKVDLVNMLGEKVMSQEFVLTANGILNGRMDVSKLVAGIYNVVVTSEDVVAARKLIVTK
jgi:hypothetical protein